MTELLRDRYELLEIAGSGGEGRVVRALDRQHARTVALKIRTVTDGSKRDILLREAGILLTLQPHPGLPLVREDFFDGDDYVIAMDWVEGTDLAHLLRDNGRPGLPVSSVLRYVAEAAEALTHLHTHDPPVVHCDVKPANLVLSRGGRVVLVDFGISSSPSVASVRAGTPGYVAPEVAAGSPPTRAADVYALAATAHALLTGEVPSGERASFDAVDDPRAGAIEAAIALGLSTDPAARPPSPGEFVERLRAGWEADLPSGVLTFCFTDIEGSSRLWDEHPGAMARALVRHDSIVAGVVEGAGGRLIQSMGEGDSTFSVFQDPGAAVRAMVDAVTKIEAESWPDGIELRVRAGVHTGESEMRHGNYFGTSVNRAARVRGLADGGQIFLSQVTAELVSLPAGMTLVDLGPHTLRGIRGRESVHAVSGPGLTSPPSPAVCPYRGLLAFGPDHHDFFFGRDLVTDELLDRLLTKQLVCVVGASGSGKSSLVGAGIVVSVRNGALRGITGVETMTPGTDPAKELRRLAIDASTLLIVDQFEELFTLTEDDGERVRFVDALLALPGKIVIALRSDFYGECAAFPELAAAVAANQVLLGPMRPSELRTAIEAPAAAVGLKLEPGLVDLILRDVEGEPGALPLLQHALLETWEQRDGRTLTLEGYEDAGGVNGAIALTADREFDDFDALGQALVRRIFLRLTQLGEGAGRRPGEDTRRRVPRDELRFGDVQPREVDDVLARLVEARLVIVDADSVEVAHEALIREWPRLRAWLDEDREGLRIHRHLTSAARSWETMGRDPSELYRGPRLATALEGTGLDLNPAETEFLEESRLAAEREQASMTRTNRRLRSLLVGAAIALVLALIAGGVAFVQRSSARAAATRAEVSKLAAQSREVTETAPDLGLLLAVEANRHEDSIESRGAVLGALAAHPRLVTQLYGVTSNVGAAVFSPDGKLLVAVSNEEAVFFDVATHRRVGPVIHSDEGRWYGATFTNDGRTLLICNDPRNVELWDVPTRKKVGELRNPDGLALASVRLSPDGKIAAAGAVDVPHVTLFDMRTRRPMGRPLEVREVEGGAHQFAFSPDGKTLAVPGDEGIVDFWDVRTRERSGAPLRVGDAFVGSFEYLSGNRAIVGDNDSRVSVWDLTTGKRVGETMSPGDAELGGMSPPSPNGRFIAGSTPDGRIYVWEIATGEQYGPVLQADTQQFLDMTWSPDGKILATAHSRSIALWDMTGRQALGRPVAGDDEVALAPAFSPDGKTVALGMLGGGVVLRDSRSGRTTGRLATKGDVQSIAFSPDGRLLAAAGTEKSVRVWDVSTRKPAGEPIDIGEAWGWDVAFSPDGKLLAVGIDPNGLRDFFVPDVEGSALLFDVRTHRRVGKPMVPGKGHFGVLSLAFSPDGKLLATGSFYFRTQLWDVATQRKRGKAMDVPDEGIISLAFSADGRRLAAGGFSGVLRVWDVETQRPAFAPLEGGSDVASGVRFGSDGSLLADTTGAGDVRVWDAATGLAYGDRQLLGSDKPASTKVNLEMPRPMRIAFSPDSRLLVAGGIDTRAMLWNTDTDEWPKIACAVAGRNLTREEWSLYLEGETYRRTCAAYSAGSSS